MKQGIELKTPTAHTVMLWGHTGTGKTTLAARAAEHESLSPLYIFDFDQRLASLKAVLSDEALSRIYWDTYLDMGVPGQSVTKAEATLAMIEGKRLNPMPKTVLLDSFTFMNKAIMRRTLFHDKKKPNDVPQLQHYLQSMTDAESFVSRLVGCGMNVIVTAHESVDEDPVSKSKFKAIEATGKHSLILPAYFNEFWRPEIRLSGQKATYYVRVRGRGTSDGPEPRTCIKGLQDEERQEDIWDKVLIG